MLAALYTNSSVALNSVSGEGVDFELATAGISPTVVVASSHTMSDYHRKFMESQTGPVAKLGRWFQSRSLDSGSMPTENLLSKLANVGPTAELPLDKLRLLFISHRADGNQEKQLTSEQLADLRIFTGARVIYALTAATVAGAVSQTNVYDYRRSNGPNHFGAPLSCVEITLTGHEEGAGIERAVEGQVCSSKSSLFPRFFVRHALTCTDNCCWSSCRFWQYVPCGERTIQRRLYALVVPLAGFDISGFFLEYASNMKFSHRHIDTRCYHKTSTDDINRI